MKRLFLALILCFSLTGVSYAGNGCTNLSWDAVTLDEDGGQCVDLGGYNIYYGTSSGNYSGVVDVKNVTSTKICLPAGKYYFAGKSYDTTGNPSTSYSNEVVKDIADNAGCATMQNLK